jgi:hypothetical protein
MARGVLAEATVNLVYASDAVGSCGARASNLGWLHRADNSVVGVRSFSSEASRVSCQMLL